jgi:hypothetical protein
MLFLSETQQHKEYNMNKQNILRLMTLGAQKAQALLIRLVIYLLIAIISMYGMIKGYEAIKDWYYNKYIVEVFLEHHGEEDLSCGK